MERYTLFAENAAFQAMVNCFLREIDPGQWLEPRNVAGLPDDIPSEVTRFIRLSLPYTQTDVLFSVTYQSLTGRHTLAQPFTKRDTDYNWQPVTKYAVVLLLIQSIFTREHDSETARLGLLELVFRATQTVQLTTEFLRSRCHDSQLNGLSFIESEQGLLLGHWLHPTAKSRQGMHDWQHAHYSPEMGGKFQLHYFSAPQTEIESTTTPRCNAQAWLRNMAQTQTDSLDKQLEMRRHCLLALHPLQAHKVLHQPSVRKMLDRGELVDLGCRGVLFSATSSVRTLYSAELNIMVKLSIPVKVTNSLRVNKRHELLTGSALLNITNQFQGRQDIAGFCIIDDPGYVTLKTHSNTESGFELIIRDNPFYAPEVRPVAISEQSLAAVVQDPLPDRRHSRLFQLVSTYQQHASLSLSHAALKWFNRYWHCSIEPMIILFDEFGLGLEAHLQNTVVRTRHGLPECVFYRDNQGYYLARSNRERLLAISPLLSRCPDLFYDDDMIINRCCYYMFINNLFAVINRFGLDNLVPEISLLFLVKAKLERLHARLGSRGKRLVAHMLHADFISGKGNLLTRVSDIDELDADLELAVYSPLPNPLRCEQLMQINHANIITQSELTDATTFM